MPGQLLTNRGDRNSVNGLWLVASRAEVIPTRHRSRISRPSGLVHAIELSRFEQTKLTAATAPRGAHPQRVADLANTLLTTALDTWGRSWTPTRANPSYGPVSWTLVDWPGPAKPPEKRKLATWKSAATRAAAKASLTDRA
jgi:hypothetical protein